MPVERGGTAGGGIDSIAVRHTASVRHHRHAAVRGTAPHRQHGGLGGWWQRHRRSRRNHTRASRHSVSGRGTGIQRGATIVRDGRDLVIEGYEGGHFVGPTIIDDVPLDAPVYTEEVFGPVLAIVHADTYEEAMKIVNSSPFGNGSAIFTNDGGVARRFTLDVEAGMVGVNVPIPTPVAYYSFGGWKDSLLGDTHIHGPEGVRFYTRAKAITSRWPSEKTYEATMSFQREE